MKQTEWENKPMQSDTEDELNERELGTVAGGYSDVVNFDFGQGEGELPEVHDMLERMNRLANEAAGPEPLSREERLAIAMEQITKLRQEKLAASRNEAPGKLILSK